MTGRVNTRLIGTSRKIRRELSRKGVGKPCGNLQSMAGENALKSRVYTRFVRRLVENSKAMINRVRRLTDGV